MGWNFLKEKACLLAIIIVVSMFSVYLINPVFAQDEPPAPAEENLACCERTLSGEACRNTQASNCDPAYKAREFQTCEESDFCKPGCCISPDGSCSKQVPQGTCDTLGGYTFDPDATCNIPKCSKGCCVLGGSSCLYSTEKKCNSVLQEYPEIAKDYRPVGSEQECTNVCRAADKGCCVKDDGTCKYEARGTCTLPDGTDSTGFYNDIFCSNLALSQSCGQCVSHEGGKACIEGSEDAYWFDSCGNQEELAENCDYGTGTLCSSADENNPEAYCKSVNCDAEHNSQPKQNVNVKNNEIQIDDYSANDRRNGESWCLYDGKVGASYDLVGSRHFRSLCLNGEQVVEPCKDLREEICWQMDLTNLPETISSYREASCLENNAKGCASECNSAIGAEGDEKKLKIKADEQCCNNPDRSCIWQWTNESHTDGFCLPRVPPGGKFWPEDSQSTGQQGSELAQTCSVGRVECNAVWEKSADTGFDWECVKNCECYSKEYLGQKATYCRALGDCGASYNYVGYWSSEGLYRTFSGEWKGWDGEPEDSKKVDETIKDPGNFEETSKVIESQSGLYLGYFSYKEIKSMYQKNGIDLGKTFGAGSLSGALMFLPAIFFSVKRPREIAVAALVSIGVSALVVAGVLAIAGGSFSAVAAAAAVVPVYGWIIAAAIIIALGIIAFWAENENRAVTIECQPWQPPTGGDNCEICDQDDLKPCSEYRCKSLGATCQFIKENEGTRKGTCYNADPNDVTRPIIEAWPETLQVISKRQDVTSQFTITPLQEGGLEGGYQINEKIPSFSKITFGIHTNELSQCRLGTEIKNTYNELTLPFPDTYFANWHNITFAPLLPSKKYEYYVICRDPSGNPKEDGRTAPFKIQFETDDGPDLEAPLIIATSVPNNGKVQANANALPLGLYVDEVSQFGCKYSIQDKDYELMENNATCLAAAAEGIFAEYPICAANLTIVGEEPNTFYFRCKDKPARMQGDAEDPPQNVNEGSYIYTVTRSKPLKITQTSPQGQTIYARDATLQARTAEGANNGIARCYYEGSGYTAEFFKTNQSDGIHEQNFVGLPKGFYNFNVTCFDSVSNAASDNINFTIDVDLDAPIVTGIYGSGSSVNVQFNEPATCEYKNESFAYGNGIKSGTLQILHSFLGLPKYHIMCEDSFQNRLPNEIIILPIQQTASQPSL